MLLRNVIVLKKDENKFDISLDALWRSVVFCFCKYRTFMRALMTAVDDHVIPCRNYKKKRIGYRIVTLKNKCNARPLWFSDFRYVRSLENEYEEKKILYRWRIHWKHISNSLRGDCVDPTCCLISSYSRVFLNLIMLRLIRPSFGFITSWQWFSWLRHAF